MANPSSVSSPECSALFAHHIFSLDAHWAIPELLPSLAVRLPAMIMELYTSRLLPELHPDELTRRNLHTHSGMFPGLYPSFTVPTLNPLKKCVV